MAIVLYLSTDPSTDLHNAGERNTAPAQAAFAQAWKRAAQIVAETAGCEVITYAGSSAPKHDDLKDAGLRALTAEGIDRDTAHEIINAVWQAVHECTDTSRPGRWSVDVREARRRGAALAKRLADAPRRGVDDE